MKRIILGLGLAVAFALASPTAQAAFINGQKLYSDCRAAETRTIAYGAAAM
jgi:hypothetical protein